MSAETSVRHRAELHATSEFYSPETLSGLGSIFDSVWQGLKDHRFGETAKDEVAKRVMMYSKSGLEDAKRIELAVLNSFGLSAEL
jgi:hypothetical protein